MVCRAQQQNLAQKAAAAAVALPALLAANPAFALVSGARQGCARWLLAVTEDGQNSCWEPAAPCDGSLNTHAPPPPPRPQVDDRLNGDGTGKILGINDPALFWVIAGVFTTVWSIYYLAGRDIDGGDNVSARPPAPPQMSRCRAQHACTSRQPHTRSRLMHRWRVRAAG